MSGSEIEELAQRIYKKHKRALDLIYENRPDLQVDIKEILERKIAVTPGLVLDYSTKSYVIFAVEDWDVPELLEGQGWLQSGRILLFQFDNFQESLRLKLLIGPGPIEIRTNLLNKTSRLSSVGSPFKMSKRTLGKKWNTIYLRDFLLAADYEETEFQDIEQKIQQTWTSFVENDLVKIKEKIKEFLNNLED